MDGLGEATWSRVVGVETVGDVVVIVGAGAGIGMDAVVVEDDNLNGRE